MNFQDWFPLEWTGLFSLLSKGLSRVFSSTIVQKHQFFGAQPFFIVPLSHLYVTTGKTVALTERTFVGKVMSLLFNTLSGFVIAFLPRSKSLLMSWLQSPSTMTLEPRFHPWVPKGPLEKAMATHSSILAWRFPWAEEPGWAPDHQVTKSWTQLSDIHFTSKDPYSLWPWRIQGSEYRGPQNTRKGETDQITYSYSIPGWQLHLKKTPRRDQTLGSDPVLSRVSYVPFCSPWAPPPPPDGEFGYFREEICQLQRVQNQYHSK